MRAKKLRNSVLAVFVFAAPLAAREPEMPPLPELKLGATFAIVQRQVNQAYSRARAHPTDAAANGKLGMVLDAYEQYESAALCYRRAHALDPKSDRKSTRLNSSHITISYAVFCLKKKKKEKKTQ